MIDCPIRLFRYCCMTWISPLKSGTIISAATIQFRSETSPVGSASSMIVRTTSGGSSATPASAAIHTRMPATLRLYGRRYPTMRRTWAKRMGGSGSRPDPDPELNAQLLIPREERTNARGYHPDVRVRVGDADATRMAHLDARAALQHQDRPFRPRS